MNKTHQTIRIWKTTLKVLRLIHAETGEPLVTILDRVLQEELSNIKQQSLCEDTPCKK